MQNEREEWCRNLFQQLSMKAPEEDDQMENEDVSEQMPE